MGYGDPGTSSYSWSASSFNEMPTGIDGNGQYDSRLGIYTPRNANLYKTKAKLAQATAGTGNCEIALFGASTIAGVPNNSSSQSMPWYLTQRLVARGLPAIYGWANPQHDWSALGTLKDSRWNTGSGTTDWNTYNAFKVHFIVSRTGAARTATFTSTNTGTIAELVVPGASGAFGWSIDGGTVTNVGAAGSANNVNYISVTGLANTTHTITVTTVNAAVFLGRARVRKAAGEIQVSNYGFSGATLQDWDETTTTVGPVAPALTLQNFPYQAGPIPDFALFDAMIWVNDAGSNTVDQNYIRTYLRRIVNQIKARGTDVALYISGRPSTTAVADATYQANRQAIYAAADELVVPLVDAPERIGPWATANANGMKQADGLHATPAGYASDAVSVEQLLLS